jgi:hypothetical protein
LLATVGSWNMDLVFDVLQVGVGCVCGGGLLFVGGGGITEGGAVCWRLLGCETWTWCLMCCRYDTGSKGTLGCPGGREGRGKQKGC